MAKMLIQNVLQYLDPDEALLDPNDPGSYNSYTIPDDTVVQMVPPGNDDDEFYTLTFVQVMLPTDKDGKLKSGPLEVICQIEGLPEEPISTVMDTEVKVRVYNQIV